MQRVAAQHMKKWIVNEQRKPQTEKEKRKEGKRRKRMDVRAESALKVSLFVRFNIDSKNSWS